MHIGTDYDLTSLHYCLPCHTVFKKNEFNYKTMYSF